MILKKSFTIILTLVVLSIVAGCYGILHDVITYKISHEYFTKFKFIAFGLIEPGTNLPVNTLQLLVITGWAATWWVGFIAGGIFSAVAFGIKKSGRMANAILRASVIMILSAVIAGIVGYNVGFFIPPPQDVAALCHECATLMNPDAFITAGYVHNFSYAGGFIGIVLGVVSILKYKRNITTPVVLKQDSVE